MNNKEIFYVKTKTTEDCIMLIDPLRHEKWKRVSKFTIKTDDAVQEVRVFSNGVKKVSVVSEHNTTTIFNIDLQPLKSTIEQIQKHAKRVYTHDYGGVWLNPFDMKVWVSGGDGGIVYSTLSPKQICKKLNDGDWDYFDDNLYFTTIDGITEEIVEAETSPDEDDDYLYVAVCRDISEYDEYE